MLTILSLGAGVQSTTLALLATHGVVTPLPDGAIFADTGEEPAAVYRHLDWLMGVLPFPVHVVRAWDGYGKPGIKARLGDEILASARGESKQGSHSRPPLFTMAPDGTRGLIRRQCTGDYKIDPIQAKIRELLGLRRRQRWPGLCLVEQWIGISRDEATRMKPVMQRLRNKPPIPHPTIRTRWPLVEVGFSRWSCLEWLKVRGYPEPPKSACSFCPYHSDAQWRVVRDTDPEGWARAIEIDEAVRTGLAKKAGLRSKLYLHGSCVPLREVDLTEPASAQMNLFENECEGMCGV